MKINNNHSNLENCFTFFAQNKINIPKKNATKTRNDYSSKSNFLKLNSGESRYEFNYVTKPKYLQYPKLFETNEDKKLTNNLFDDSHYYMFSNNITSRKNNNNERIFPSNNDKNENINECPESADTMQKNKKDNKYLFDSNFNLLFDKCGDDEVMNMIKEIAKIKINSPKKEKKKNVDNEKIFTNTGDSLNVNYNDKNQ